MKLAAGQPTTAAKIQTRPPRPALLDMVEIMSTAKRLRQEAGFRSAPYSAKALLDACYPDVLVTGDAGMPHGVTEIVENHRDGRTIWYNRRQNTAAQRIGIVHGLAHLIFDELGERRCTIAGAADPAERRADLFAGEILAPFEDLNRCFGEIFPKDPIAKREFDDTVDHVSSTFKVPPGFLRWRLYDLAWLRKTNFYVAR